MTDIAGFSTLEYLAHINASFSNEKLCEWTQNQRIEYKTLLDALEQSNGTNSCATKEEKGRSLEEIASFLLNNCGHIFDVDRNIPVSYTHLTRGVTGSSPVAATI